MKPPVHHKTPNPNFQIINKRLDLWFLSMGQRHASQIHETADWEVFLLRHNSLTKFRGGQWTQTRTERGFSRKLGSLLRNLGSWSEHFARQSWSDLLRVFDCVLCGSKRSKEDHKSTLGAWTDRRTLEVEVGFKIWPNPKLLKICVVRRLGNGNVHPRMPNRWNYMCGPSGINKQ